MQISDIIEAMESIAPPYLAEDWDNVGLLVGRRDADAARVMLTIDLTDATLAEAIASEVQLLISYHPPIFHPFTALTDDDPKQRLVLRAAEEGIGIYSPHTALDATEDGVNDWLARGLGSGDVRALRAFESLPRNEATKIVTFCPSDEVDRVRSALSTVGAGNIGEYQMCSFELEGTGTFFGGDRSNPAIGEKGQLERVSEVRLEMVCPVRSLALAVTTIRQFHPYEEPPIEIYALRPRPDRHMGAGRRIVLDQPAPLLEIVERIRTVIGSKRVLVAPSENAPKSYRTLGVCAGAGGSLLHRAIEEGCELFFTGEMSHHAVLDAQARGCTVVLAGHTNTERGYLPKLESMLSSRLPELSVIVSKKDCDPLRLV